MDDTLAMLNDNAITVHSGFPNPAVDRLNKQRSLDLNQLLVHHPSSTYLFNINGHQFEDNGIFHGDIALIDRVIEPTARDLVVAWQTSGFIICRYNQLAPSDSFWGVIASTIHQRNH
jgi:DNA polymerase V